MNWALPANLSAQGVAIGELYYLILGLTALAFLIVEAGILWFVVRYRQRDGRRAFYTHGSNRLEIAWTAIPAVVFVALAVYSATVWGDLRSERSIPESAFTIGVTASQFEWQFTYPGADGELGTDADFTVRNHLHLPVDQTVVARLESEDVIHSFWVPALRVKQDAVPGMTTPVWFEATGTGEFELGCAELCGLGHYRMRAEVTIYEAEEFERWHAERSEQALARAGAGI